MSLHQVICLEHQNEIIVRDLSCFCQSTIRCDCFATRVVNVCKNTPTPTTTNDEHDVGVSIPVPSLASVPSNTLHEIDFSSDLVGCWVVVNYDEKPYPGIVQDISHDQVSVKVMHCIGKNRYFWPAREDVFGYCYDEVVLQFAGMESVTSRHMQMPLHTWQCV
ncbi:hypothetical protein DPMN_049005 [Dreissena polymorpha]|uniref:Uncharacterized protein n=1 Tax=Dreissena polymorpha TaxID=45954 RepID=A0A9D4I2W7_DREPO|nr:hypothetical protein DPMN_049005 [Dreissena polymorpha]